MADKAKSLGIPFDPDFNRPVVREDILRKLKLKTELPTILIMGGGQGLGPIKTIVTSLGKIKNEFQEIIVCGINKKLYNSLNRMLRKHPKKAILFGYVDNINEMMAVSDLIITKPGGVTTAEALAKKLPMIIVRPIPGQENNNTDYLISKGAAVKIGKVKDINVIVENLLNDNDKLKRLRDQAGQISKPNASLDIARLLLDLSNRRV
ncbi:MAG: glycosyltransferase [Candidatus Omnitrophota bacterium]